MAPVTFAKLNDDLGRIHEQVTALRLNQEIFKEVQKMFRENKNLHGKPATFHKWLGNMYAGAMTATVRRMIDQRGDAVSMIRLLNQVKANPNIFCRAEYKRRWEYDSLPRGYTDKDYDKLIGKGKQEPDPKAIDAEIDELKGKTKLLKQFVDQHVAHLAAEQSRERPTFQHLDDAIDYLDKLVLRYLHLFRGVAMKTVLPTSLYEWKKIFKYRWLEDRPNFKR